MTENKIERFRVRKRESGLIEKKREKSREGRGRKRKVYATEEEGG